MDRDDSCFVFLNEFELVGVEIEVSEMSVDKEGISDEVFSFCGCLESSALLALHCISIRVI